MLNIFSNVRALLGKPYVWDLLLPLSYGTHVSNAGDKSCSNYVSKCETSMEFLCPPCNDSQREINRQQTYFHPQILIRVYQLRTVCLLTHVLCKQIQFLFSIQQVSTVLRKTNQINCEPFKVKRVNICVFDVPKNISPCASTNHLSLSHVLFKRYIQNDTYSYKRVC